MASRWTTDPRGRRHGDVLDRADDLVSNGRARRHRRRSSRRRRRLRSSCFAAPDVEVAVIEVGLGGRFDATNVITPAAGAITTIGFDHQQYLGDTLSAIAFEKAGIIKPGMTVVTGALPPEADRVIAECAAQERAHIVPCFDGVAAETQLR